MSQNFSIAVYGKVEPGWYIACAIWDKKTAEAWKALGYAVAPCEMDKNNRPQFPSYKPDYALQ